MGRGGEFLGVVDVTRGLRWGVVSGILAAVAMVLLLRAIQLNKTLDGILIVIISTIVLFSVEQRVNPPRDPGRGRYRWSKERRQSS